MKKSDLKKIITHCLNRVHNSEGAIDNAIKEAMNAIDKYTHDVAKGSSKTNKSLKRTYSIEKDVL